MSVAIILAVDIIGSKEIAGTPGGLVTISSLREEMAAYLQAQLNRPCADTSFRYEVKAPRGDNADFVLFASDYSILANAGISIAISAFQSAAGGKRFRYVIYPVQVDEPYQPLIGAFDGISKSARGSQHHFAVHQALISAIDDEGIIGWLKTEQCGKELFEVRGEAFPGVFVHFFVPIQPAHVMAVHAPEESGMSTCLPKQGGKSANAHLEEITIYRHQAVERLRNLIDIGQEDGYLHRTAKFKAAIVKEEDKEWINFDLARSAAAAEAAAIKGKTETARILEIHSEALLLGDSGMGKSVEAARLAIALTNIKDPQRYSCCVVLDCRLLEKSNPSIGAIFDIPLAVVAPRFNTFCELDGWRRFLILDGFDEINCDETEFVRIVEAFRKEYPEIHILITSRFSAAGTNIETKFPSWKAYRLEELDEQEIVNYFRLRLCGNTQVLDSTLENWKGAPDHMRYLLRVPFFLYTFVKTVIENPEFPQKFQTGRLELLSSFVARSLNRHAEKVNRSLGEAQFEHILTAFGEYALNQTLGKPSRLERDVENLGTLFLRPDGQFVIGEVRNFLSSRFAFNNPKRLTELGGLGDVDRFTLNGWLLEHVNLAARSFATENLRRVRQWLWVEDPILVSLGLFNLEELRAVDLPVRPWEPYEMGLIRILLGRSANGDPERDDIRNARLSSPGEKFLRRLQFLDPYFIRAVPNRRAINSLRMAWASDLDTWGELMPALRPIAREWIESRYSGWSRDALLYAFELESHDGVDPVAVADELLLHSGQLKDDAAAVIARVVVLLSEYAEGPAFKTKLLFVALEQRKKALLNLLFSNEVLPTLSARRLQRLLAFQTRKRRLAQLPLDIRSAISGAIFSGNPNAPRIEDVRMKSLLFELGGVDGGLRSVSPELWPILADDVAAVRPEFLHGALRGRVARVRELEESGWLDKWMGVWFERLNAYETIRLLQKGITFKSLPPGFLDAKGWLQARDVVRLKAIPNFPCWTCTPEQKSYWLATASQRELLTLLTARIITREDGAIFADTVKSLEAKSRVEYWWILILAGILNGNDVVETAERLYSKRKRDPVAFVLLSEARMCQEEPAQAILEAIKDPPGGNAYPIWVGAYCRQFFDGRMARVFTFGDQNAALPTSKVFKILSALDGNYTVLVAPKTEMAEDYILLRQDGIHYVRHLILPKVVSAPRFDPWLLANNVCVPNPVAALSKTAYALAVTLRANVAQILADSEGASHRAKALIANIKVFPILIFLSGRQDESVIQKPHGRSERRAITKLRELRIYCAKPLRWRHDTRGPLFNLSQVEIGQIAKTLGYIQHQEDVGSGVAPNSTSGFFKERRKGKFHLSENPVNESQSKPLDDDALGEEKTPEQLLQELSQAELLGSNSPAEVERINTLRVEIIRRYVMSTRALPANPEVHVSANALIDRIETRVCAIVIETLKSRHGRDESGWWKLGIPSKIRTRIVAQREEDPERLNYEAYFFLIEYKEIIEANWELFKRLFCISPQKKASDNLDWIRKLNDIRKAAMHATRLIARGGVKVEEMEFLRERLQWIESLGT